MASTWTQDDTNSLFDLLEQHGPDVLLGKLLAACEGTLEHASGPHWAGENMTEECRRVAQMLRDAGVQ